VVIASKMLTSPLPSVAMPNPFQPSSLLQDICARLPRNVYPLCEEEAAMNTFRGH
jgi:hypothetical protein